MSRVPAKLVILEGVDRSGKDSLWDAIDRITKYKHYVHDRGPVGFLVYDEFYDKSPDRHIDDLENLKDWAKLKNVVIIYLECNTKELMRRVEETEHEPVPFDEHKALYDKYLIEAMNLGIQVEQVRTDEFLPSAIVERLIERGVL